MKSRHVWSKEIFCNIQSKSNNCLVCLIQKKTIIYLKEKMLKGFKVVGGK